MRDAATIHDLANQLIALRDEHREGRLAAADYLARSTAIWNEVLAMGLADDLHAELERRRSR